MFFALLACATSYTLPDSGATCVHALVTDIDETLTTLDSEYVDQMLDPAHDPAMRPDANTLMHAYADLGYGIFYVTARGDDVSLADGTSARDATENWLAAHDFPTDDGHVFLYDGLAVTGEDTRTYKAGVLAALADDGWTFDYGYGNATTDIEAWQDGGIADENIFLVGKLAGDMGVEPITDEDAYTEHMAAQMPNVPAIEGCR